MNALGTVFFTGITDSAILEKILGGDLVNSCGLADSRYDLEHAVGDRSVHRHVEKFLSKVDAVDDNFCAGKMVVWIIDGLLAPHSTATKAEGLSEIEQLGALDVLSICDGDGVSGQRLALLAAAAKES